MWVPGPADSIEHAQEEPARAKAVEIGPVHRGHLDLDEDLVPGRDGSRDLADLDELGTTVSVPHRDLHVVMMTRCPELGARDALRSPRT